jgi:hypothetical protein
LLVEPVEAISFVMSRRMLRGIKQRAERGARCAATVGLVSWTPTTQGGRDDKP